MCYGWVVPSCRRCGTSSSGLQATLFLMASAILDDASSSAPRVPDIMTASLAVSPLY